MLKTALPVLEHCLTSQACTVLLSNAWQQTGSVYMSDIIDVIDISNTIYVLTCAVVVGAVHTVSHRQPSITRGDARLQPVH